MVYGLVYKIFEYFVLCVGCIFFVNGYLRFVICNSICFGFLFFFYNGFLNWKKFGFLFENFVLKCG